MTSRFLEAIGSEHEIGYDVAVTDPTGTTRVPLAFDAADFTINATGARYTANLTLGPSMTEDLWSLVAAPGAKFSIRAGVTYGGNDRELVDCGVYEVSAGTHVVTVGETPLSLVDGTTRLARCRFIAPRVAAGGTRAAAIAAMVTDASPGTTVIINADGGTMPLTVFDRDRIGAINQIAADGSLDAAFNGAGQFVINPAPVITPAAPTWTVHTGAQANLLDASREQSLDRLYNTVVVLPVDELQTWSVVTISVQDPNHPRHRSKIGVVPFFLQSPMITTEAQAAQAANTTLQELVASSEQIQVSNLGNPALEFGDTLAVFHAKTATDPGLAANYLLQSATFDLKSHDQKITARSNSLAELEEL